MDVIKYIVIYTVLIAAAWVMGTVFAKSVSDVEIIQPEAGIKCAIASRMFNTSIDCWKE